MSMVFAEKKAEFQPTHIVRDRDAKFTHQFCAVLELDGIEFRPIPPRSPNVNPYAESWVGRTKAECLNHFIVFGEEHLRHILQEWGFLSSPLAAPSGAGQRADRHGIAIASASRGVSSRGRGLPGVARWIAETLRATPGVRTNLHILMRAGKWCALSSSSVPLEIRLQRSRPPIRKSHVISLSSFANAGRSCHGFGLTSF
jgi:hypothetical protein